MLSKKHEIIIPNKSSVMCGVASTKHSVPLHSFAPVRYIQHASKGRPGVSDLPMRGLDVPIGCLYALCPHSNILRSAASPSVRMRCQIFTRSILLLFNPKSRCLTHPMKASPLILIDQNIISACLSLYLLPKKEIFLAYAHAAGEKNRDKSESHACKLALGLS